MTDECTMKGLCGNKPVTTLGRMVCHKQGESVYAFLGLNTAKWLVHGVVYAHRETQEAETKPKMSFSLASGLASQIETPCDDVNKGL
ncbi:hypothetical protein VNO77_15285 [Canavalia gladiata]|uniref:Uncharacterized protein n=1 Tax=Canavalia gladiata TaxID=3824 RepID=A0AAN9QR56_CANGL